MSDVVIYHNRCNDGFCAAWLHWRHRDKRAEFVAADYGDEPPSKELIAGADVFIYDFSYPRDALVRMHRIARTLNVFDHHRTAAAELEGLSFCIFDPDSSGARLAADFLQCGHNWLVDYTEDRDLWRFDLPESRAVDAGLRMHGRAFDVWELLYARGVRALAAEGRPILHFKEQCIKDLIAGAGWVSILKHRVPIVNIGVQQLMSEAIGALAKRYNDAPFAAGYRVGPRFVTISLRSRSGFDVSKVARPFGGGGHRAAAGFRVSRTRFFETMRPHPDRTPARR